LTAWITGVSNPIHSPRFRTSASVLTQKATFVFGIPLNIYEFYLSTQNSTFLYQTQVLWLQCRDSFLKRWLQHTKKNSLRTLYAQSFRITLAPSVLPRLLAQKFAGAFCILQNSNIKEFTTNNAFILHVTLLDQACAHCPKFPTAAFRKSLDRVSVPVWLDVLSNQLKIFGLVEPLPYQLPNLT